MKLGFADLWKPSGPIDRQLYIVVGFIGFAVKHNIDRLVATVLYDRKWELLNYWIPLNTAVRVTQLSRAEVSSHDGRDLAAVCLDRGRNDHQTLAKAALPLSLILLFFFPFLNLAFSLLLCLIPERTGVKEKTATSHIRSSLAAIVPESASGSALFSLLFTVPAGLDGGQFLLTRLPNGATRLEGTTWYVHGLWPATYWRFWSDAVIHQIHLRVLKHIRDQAECRIQ